MQAIVSEVDASGSSPASAHAMPPFDRKKGPAAETYAVNRGDSNGTDKFEADHRHDDAKYVVLADAIDKNARAFGDRYDELRSMIMEDEIRQDESNEVLRLTQDQHALALEGLQRKLREIAEKTDANTDAIAKHMDEFMDERLEDARARDKLGDRLAKHMNELTGARLEDAKARDELVGRLDELQKQVRRTLQFLSSCPGSQLVTPPRTAGPIEEPHHTVESLQHLHTRDMHPTPDRTCLPSPTSPSSYKKSSPPFSGLLPGDVSKDLDGEAAAHRCEGAGKLAGGAPLTLDLVSTEAQGDPEKHGFFANRLMLDTGEEEGLDLGTDGLGDADEDTSTAKLPRDSLQAEISRARGDRLYQGHAHKGFHSDRSIPVTKELPDAYFSPLSPLHAFRRLPATSLDGRDEALDVVLCPGDNSRQAHEVHSPEEGARSPPASVPCVPSSSLQGACPIASDARPVSFDARSISCEVRSTSDYSPYMSDDAIPSADPLQASPPLLPHDAAPDRSDTQAITHDTQRLSDNAQFGFCDAHPPSTHEGVSSSNDSAVKPKKSKRQYRLSSGRATGAKTKWLNRRETKIARWKYKSSYDPATNIETFFIDDRVERDSDDDGESLDFDSDGDFQPTRLMLDGGGEAVTEGQRRVIEEGNIRDVEAGSSTASWPTLGSTGTAELDVRPIASNRVEVRDVPETLDPVRSSFSSAASAEQALCLLREALQGIPGSSLPGIGPNRIPLDPPKVQPEVLSDGFVDLPPRSYVRALSWSLERATEVELFPNVVDFIPSMIQRGMEFQFYRSLSCLQTPQDMMASSPSTVSQAGAGPWWQAPDVHAAYQNSIREVLSRPHAVRFITKGGILWRLALHYGGPNILQRATAGVSTSVTLHKVGHTIHFPFPAIGDEVTGDEERLIIGYSEHGRSLWPPPAIFDESPLYHGEWTEAAETWFLDRLSKHSSGKGPFLITGSQWRQSTGYSLRPQNGKTSKRFAQGLIKQASELGVHLTMDTGRRKDG
ncbi:hypothetical protein BV25DRAFT_1921751 [Artomyces pyxidatus]|uniref:Uncharacterized protein n=1 Tax=Artomyces pyxidatus TaxID=48021 RepID=A0ACB8SH12_9AGAM|nr:hypothetical protein BV25DRAFT_1921751 [Artomyces pyxidatus]